MTSPEKGGNERPVARGVTAGLLARYDRPGPRYTSYPTAVEFAEGFTETDYTARLAEADRMEEEPLSMYLHLPFCEERCLFCGCHVIIMPEKSRASSYLDLLRRETDLLARRLARRRSISQLHLGGGTPTYHDPQELVSLLSHLLSRFRPTPNAELAVEVDPRVTTDEHVDALAELGFNRISMGVQDFTPRVQEGVDRVQTVEETARIIRRARDRGYTGINIDLIYGLPHQTPETFERTVELTIELGADRSAVYSFAYVPWIRGHQKKIDERTLPDRDTKFSLFAIARERFLEAGYEPIGMDHFAKPEDELSRAKREGRLRRNFQGYTVIPAEDVVGLGISAIGDVRGAYVQNEKKLSRYTKTVQAGRLPVERGLTRTPDDEVRRRIIHDLMCNFRVDVASIEREFGLRFAETFAEDLGRLRAHEREGLVEIRDDAVRATPTGELFIRNLALCFDRYWREKHEGDERPIFSRTV
jgi:oxygen-independent coproporphyrinogen-3 oxidase